MESSRRAVESYWRSRMIDAATSDEDKVTPVYKLEEICDLLRSSHPSIVKEVSEFILKRIDHKSPIVKQKALRLIKYAVGKSDAEFRREMQRHSVAVRQLLHYKGHLDPLKGDALNKSVRETAQATLSAIFSTDDSKPAPSEGLNKRIQGFGNTNYEMPSEEKKSFLSEVVGLGSASIKQGLSTLTQGHSQKKNDAGSYKGPNLQRSLTIETNNLDQYEKMGYHVGSQGNSGISKNAIAGAWGQESRITAMEATKEDSAAGYSESKTREERLLETIVTSGGVRLQPTRDALQAFLVEALRVDAVALSHALEQKLQSPLWQVRMKAVCVLEAILRKDDQHFSVVASYFTENKDVVLRCSESPQASLREKANKVLRLLGEEQTGGDESHADNLATSETESGVEMPDLIDTGTPNDLFGAEDSKKAQSDQNVGNLSTLTSPFFDDLFGGDVLSTSVGNSKQKIDVDPFADVSFHLRDHREKDTTIESADLFSGMTVGDNSSDNAVSMPKNNGRDPFDIFGSDSEPPPKQENHDDKLRSLMAGLSISGNASGAFPETIFPNSIDSRNGRLDSQTSATNANAVFAMDAIPYAIPPGIMSNQLYCSQSINYGAMGSFHDQQQFRASMANRLPLASFYPQNAGVDYADGTSRGYSSPLPDIFHTSMPTRANSMKLNNSKETKAFDFISDHIAEARDTKRIA